MFGAAAAHFFGRLQTAAESRPFRLTKDAAPIILCKLDAPDTRRLSIRHSGYRARDGRRNAACTAVRATVHDVVNWPMVCPPASRESGWISKARCSRQHNRAGRRAAGLKAGRRGWRRVSPASGFPRWFYRGWGAIFPRSSRFSAPGCRFFTGSAPKSIKKPRQSRPAHRIGCGALCQFGTIAVIKFVIS